MHKLTPITHRHWSWLLLGLLLACLCGAPAAAQDLDSQDLDALRGELAQLEERFNVLTTAEGLGLTPKDEAAEFALLEIRYEALAVDGIAVDDEALEELIGSEDAQRVLALHQLDSDQLRALKRPASLEMEERLARIAELQEQRDRELAELEELQQELEAFEEEKEDEWEEKRYYTDDRFSFGNSLTIDANESTNDVVVIGGSLGVEGEVLGDAVVIGGSAEVQGMISGDLTAVGGSISVGPEARIEGEVTSVGGSIHDPHNRVRGSSVQVDLGPFEGFDGMSWHVWDWDDDWSGDWGPSIGWRWGSLVFSLICLAFIVLWILLLTLINRNYVDAIAQQTDREPWKSALVGLVTQVLLFPFLVVICLILVVSVIGIPVLIILLPVGMVALVIFSCFGYAGIALWSGRWLKRRFEWSNLGIFTLVALGILLIEGWSLVGEALSEFGGPIQLSAWLILTLGFFVEYVAWTTGFGSVILMALGRRRRLQGGDWDGGGTPGGLGPSTGAGVAASGLVVPETEPGDYGEFDFPETGYGSGGETSGVVPIDDGDDDGGGDDDDDRHQASAGNLDTWHDPFETQEEVDETSSTEDWDETRSEEADAEEADADEDPSDDTSDDDPESRDSMS